jgi:hypothetical protein
MKKVIVNKTNVNDALGNPIEFYKLYGYSLDQNGHMTVTVGTPIYFTPSGKVTLSIMKKSASLWKDEPDTWEEISGKVSVKSGKLFPVTLEDINRKK